MSNVRSHFYDYRHILIAIRRFNYHNFYGVDVRNFLIDRIPFVGYKRVLITLPHFNEGQMNMLILAEQTFKHHSLTFHSPIEK
jgi:hypothetical protein